jgi:hypothetical protein
MAEPQVAYAQDEYGRPFIVVREQGKKTRAQGIQALKNHISVRAQMTFLYSIYVMVLTVLPLSYPFAFFCPYRLLEQLHKS